MERRDGMKRARVGEPHRLFARGLEVGAVLDEVGAERAHGGVLLRGIPLRHDDGDRKAEPPPGEGEALTVIAARRGNQPRGVRRAPAEPVDERHSAAHLEGAGGMMVFVLDDDLGAEPAREQRPGERRRRAQRLPHDFVRVAQFVEAEHGRTPVAARHTSILPFSSMTEPISTPASSPSSASNMSLCALPDGIIGKQFSF